MATVVTFHAHPDDECIATGGLMAGASAAGHRVVLVTATDGAVGEVADGFLREAETLAERRAQELAAAAEVLGAARVEFLGYRDSGMIDMPTNADPSCFWQADVEEAAQKLAAILREEQADVLTVYDQRGNYGHPDHIQVHRVGVRAAELAGTPEVYEATVDRDEMVRLMKSAAETGQFGEVDEAEIPDFEAMELGVPSEQITTRLDVRPWLAHKRKAMAAHASQITEQSFFLAMPEEAFAAAFGTECFIRRGDTSRPDPLPTLV